MKNLAFVALFAVAACDGTIDVQTRTAEVQAPGCTHGVCVAGSPLAPSCTSCTTAICQADPYCCNIAWDATCVGEADSLCNNRCQTSCSIGEVPIVEFAAWDKKLPPPLGRRVLVFGPWTSPERMSVAVFQEQLNEVVLVAVMVRPDLPAWFTAVNTSSNDIIVSGTPGIGPAPPGPIGPAGQIIEAAQELARGLLQMQAELSCTVEVPPVMVPEM